MYKVNVSNPCSCFIRNGFVESQEFTTKEEAKEEANKLMQTMKSNFCQKHDFSMSEQFGDFNIYIKPRR
ncbi:hypothetical protein GJV85_09245 [Sulfurimonas aquatica]|uniref:Uncharacterized protein n=1 Tax=Sulfurimonas aquatica TaxID=2672570 RepID=A0A975B141_9BACT|nr:hypothetical protein [Sulfurimonas aquatica]QSZ42282.1 hypothetical protein GJV85_09245 [Sulfurimonas aquatica]